MNRLATTVLALAALVLCWAAWNAWHVEGVGDRGFEARGGFDRNTPETASTSYDLARVLAAVDKDPFQVDRRRPGQRFRPAADLASAPPSATNAPPPVELIGTAVSPDGGFAVCALGGGSPRIVRIGQRVGDWTLNRVTKGAAEFATPGGTTVVVRIAKAGT